jgi:hypothetical protein
MTLVARGEPPTPRTPLDYAERMVAAIHPEGNEYVHRNVRLSWPAADGTGDYACHADCSGFYTLLLQHAYGWDDAYFKTWLGTARPLAKRWHDAIESEDRFTRIHKAQDLRPGDVIAWKFEPGEKEDTGHVVLVAAEPKPREATEPLAENTRQWEVTIIDSSKSGHGTKDTRRKPDKTFYQGAGKGTLRLYTKEDGEIVGYSWSVLKASQFYPTEQHPIAAGRLKTPAPK